MMDKKQIEEKLIEFFEAQMWGEGERYFDVSYIRTFEEACICTMDNGVVIDLEDGTQILLTIQTR